ncbi:MAG TPA: hypothetical protein VJI32_02910 [Candidatus Nanoarchaeia archaeon]|nr:hypothetical protein [Candidatus Nanoarchaeia archaeon]
MKTEFYQRLHEAVTRHGGIVNAHLHLDRASTLDSKYLAHVGIDPLQASSLPLSVKQDLTGDLHRGPAYEREDLMRRMGEQLNDLITAGTRKAYSFIDVTADNVRTTAFEIALTLKKEKKNSLDFYVGAYPIFGFKDDEPQRWDLFEQAAHSADFLGTLPERDARAGHIGYDEHIRRTLALAHKLQKPIHYHLDQGNDPREDGTETVIEAVRWLGSPKIEGETGATVWAVHVISPSAYEEERFERMLEGLEEYNIGVICCPSAAISMRQYRPITTPTHNSISRILEMAQRKIPVRLGSDNIADVFLPATTASLYDEVLVLANALRFYNVEVLAKLMCGVQLNNMDRKAIHDSLEEDKKVFAKMRG